MSATPAAAEDYSSSAAETLMKVAMFVLVQALVYLILSQSSNVFSKNPKRSFSFKSARSVSIRRMLAVISDMPPGGEESPAGAATVRDEYSQRGSRKSD